jgi:hypothetical protein
MQFIERLRRITPSWWVAGFAILLIIPGLGSFGFWDPWELKLAERAREIAASSSIFDVTVGKRFPAEAPLDLVFSALGMRLFSVSEWGGRLGVGLFGILAICATYWAGLGLFRRRAALIGALVLGSMPFFLFQARQVVSEMPLIAGLALSLGGLCRYTWPGDGRRRIKDLLIAIIGLFLGLYSGGALLGVVLPCVSIGGALLVGWGLKPNLEVNLCMPGVGVDQPAETPFGQGFVLQRRRGHLAVLTLIAIGILLFILTLTTANVAGKFSLLLGGVPRAGVTATTFEFLVKQLGFGLFPYSALVIFALARPLIRLGGNSEPDAGRLAFNQLYLLLFVAFGFALTSVFIFMTGEARFPAVVPMALAVGALLDEVLDGERAEPVLGLLVATGTLVVARDLVLSPEELVSSHTLGKVRWPPNYNLGPLFMAIGLLFATGIYAGLATRGRALGKIPGRDLGRAGKFHRRLESVVVGAGRYGIQVALGVAIVAGFFLSHRLLPYLSQHLSYKPLIESYTKFAKNQERIGRYRVEAQGTGFYLRREMTDLASPARVAEFLRSPDRVFALVAATELSALDATLKTERVPYVVVEASSSRFLLLSNRTTGDQEDENPLKKNVWMAPQLPTVVPSSEEGGAPQTTWPEQTSPWSWRVSLHTMFDNSIELIGADFPETIRRPGTIPLTLYFRVYKKPKPGFRIFVHFDAPGQPRLLGDHPPLNGTFPTDYWLPGEYIRDTYDVEVPLMTTPAGRYTILMGFWPGGEGKRFKITAGNNDGADRTQVGFIDIK